MRNTGFSEITPERLHYKGTDPWFIEVAITGLCNFSCKYCNRFSDQIDVKKLTSYFETFGKAKHIQVTGGEPTMHPDFEYIMRLCRNKSLKIGLSTNGSGNIEKYINSCVDMFSISLDDYDCNILRQRGYKNPEHVIETIRYLSKSNYVNVGLVIDSINIDRIEYIIDFIISLGVADIKLSTSTKDERIPFFTKEYKKFPILNYRVENFKKGHQMRGWPGEMCKIAENDITIVGGNHYPCLVYFREGGKPIGRLEGNIMGQRQDWVKTHKPKNDEICKKYCMDFKCEFNAGTYNIN